LSRKNLLDEFVFLPNMFYQMVKKDLGAGKLQSLKCILINLPKNKNTQQNFSETMSNKKNIYYFLIRSDITNGIRLASYKL